MKHEHFTKAKVFSTASWLNYPIPIIDLWELKVSVACLYEITVFDLTEPHSIVFTKDSFPEGGIE